MHSRILQGVAALLLFSASPLLLRAQPSSSAVTGARPEFHPGPTGSISRIALSSDGTRALSAGSDGVARLWDPTTGIEIRRLEGHPFAVDAVAMTPDARRAITASEQTLLLWDLANGVVLKRVTLPARLFDVALSTDTNTVFAVAFDGFLVIDLRGEPRVQRLATVFLSPHSGFRHSGAMTPDGKRAVTSGSGRDKVDVPDLPIRTVVAPAADGPVFGISSDGKTVLAGMPVRLWNLETGEELQRFADSQSSAAMTPDARFALIAGAGNQVGYWDLTARRRLTSIPGDRVAAIAGDGRTGIIGANGGYKVWDLRTGRQIREFAPTQRPVISVAQTPDASRILFATFDTAFLWDTKAGREIGTLDCAGAGQGINSVALSADGARALLGCQAGASKLIDLNTGREIRRVAAGANLALAGVSITPDAKLAVFNVSSGSPSIWNLATGAEAGRIPLRSRAIDDIVLSTALSADGRFLLALHFGSAHLWDLQNNTDVRRFEKPSGRSAEQFRNVAMTPDGRWAVIGSSHTTARLWDVQSGTDVWTLRKGDDYNHAIDSVALTPDGNSIVTGVGGDAAELWDARTRTQVARFVYPEQGAFTHAAITADGRFVTASIGPAVRIWTSNGKSWMTLYSYRGGWAVLDDQGRYDTSDPQNCPAIYGVTAEGSAIPVSALKTFDTPSLLSRFLQ